MRQITPQIFKQLHQPKSTSRKGDNGRLLIIAGSKQYHGALLYAVKAASRIVDLIYVLTTNENQNLIKQLKSKTAEFITVTNFKQTLTKIDCVLIGPGLGKSSLTTKLVTQVIKSTKKVVLDADALTSLTPTTRHLLGKQHILTPHAGEFKKTFGLAPNAKNLQAAVKKYGCTIILKSNLNLIGSPNHPIIHNPTGNAGMTKGGTGDVLAGLVAALYCNNDSYTSACAGAYLNGKAGDELYKKIGVYYNAEDLVEQIPKTLKNLI